MTRKIVTVLVLAPLALIVSGVVFAYLSDQPADPVSALTGCGVTASANSECLGECMIEFHLCRWGCAPLPDDCRVTPPGPECDLYMGCMNQCEQEWISCKMGCGP